MMYGVLKKIEEFILRGLKDKISKKPEFKFKVFLLYLLFVCLGVLVANIFFRFISKHSLNTADVVDMPILPKTLPEETPILSPPSSSVVEDKQQPDTSFVLNGVFISDNESFAMVNNRVVKEGDQIEGATVVEITLDGVKIESGGSIINLSQ